MNWKKSSIQKDWRFICRRYRDTNVSDEDFIKYRKNIQLMKADIKNHINNQKRN